MQKKAQASMEYLLSVAALLILMFVMYSLSVDMQIRQQLINTELESQRTAQRVATAMDFIAILGDGASTEFNIGTHPDHYIKTAGSQVVVFGLSNHSVTIVSSFANLSAASSTMQTNQDIMVVNNDSTIQVSSD
jgi:hypothetical protein